MNTNDSLLVSTTTALAAVAFVTACTTREPAPASAATREAGVRPDGARGARSMRGMAVDAGKTASGVRLSWQVFGLAPLGPYVGGDRDAARGDPVSDAAVPANYLTGPVEGVKVCGFRDTSIPCTVTDAMGRFSVSGLPAKSEAVLSFERAGYFSMLMPIETGATDMDGSIAGPLPLAAIAPPASLPVALDTTKGLIVVFAVEPPSGTTVSGAEGTRVSLTPKSGDGPYFITERNVLDISATAIVHQTALYVNLDPGTYEVAFENQGQDCAPLSVPFGFGFAAGKSSVKLPVASGFQTLGGALCTPSSVIVNTGD